MKNLTTTILAIALSVGAFAQVTPPADRIWNSDGSYITGLTDGMQIEIRTGASGTLTVPDNVTVTIVSDGAVTNNQDITLNLQGTGTRVNWRADYSFTSALYVPEIGCGSSFWSVRSDSERVAVNLRGAGTLDVVEGGSITATGAWSAAIRYFGRWECDYEYTATIRVSGGTARTIGGQSAIDVFGGGKIEVTGGVVSSIGVGPAISSDGSASGRGADQIIISGGVVSATTGRAIVAAGWGEDYPFVFSVSGGLIIAQGTEIVSCRDEWGGIIANNVISHIPTEHTGGAIVAHPATGTFTAGTSEGLVFLPDVAPTAVWYRIDDISGIRANTGEFVGIPDITIRR